jgi:hypothetical protein
VTESLIPAQPPPRPDVVDLMQALATLKALRDYLESPEGRVRAGQEFVEIHSLINLLGTAIERLTVAGPDGSRA